MATGQSVYWVGQDGNIYYMHPTSSGWTTQNMGSATDKSVNSGVSGTGFTSLGQMGAQQQILAKQVQDPATIAQSASTTAPTDPNATGTTGTASNFQDKSADIAAQNAQIDAINGSRTTKDSGVDASLKGLMGNYDNESKANEGTYSNQSDTNRNNLESNKESALVNAAQGRQGLMGTLSSLGALSDDSIKLADRAVQSGANQDLTGSENTFTGNQGGLDAAIAKFRADDAKRRQDANTAAGNAKKKDAYDAAVGRQGAYNNLAGDYTAEGDTANSQKYAQMGAAEAGNISANAVADTSNLGPENAAFTAPSLANYMAGQGNTTVNSAPTGGTGTGKSLYTTLLASNDKKQKAIA